MIKIFVSYAREDAPTVTDLVEVIHGLGDEPWMDRELRGGQVWWQEILAQIRGCDLFICAVSPSSCRSTACTRELIYADALGKTILPVMIHPVGSMATLPPQLASRQILEYRPQDASAVMHLARALHEAPPSAGLIDPLPEPPEVPLSYLGKVGLDLGQDELSFAEQSQILLDLKAAMGDPVLRGDALPLLERFRQRPDLFARIEREIESLQGPPDQGWGRARSMPEGPAASARASGPTRRRARMGYAVSLAVANFLAFLIFFAATNEPEILVMLPASLSAGIAGYYGARKIAGMNGVALLVGVAGGVLGIFMGGTLASSLTNNDTTIVFWIYVSQALAIFIALTVWARVAGSRASTGR